MKTTIDWPKRFTELQVFSQQERVGTLVHDSQYVFGYSESAPRPCSLTMPVRIESYVNGALHPAFEMNLPEGFLRRYISERLVRYTKVNDMLFLALQGDRGIGHLNYRSGLDFGQADMVSMNDLLTTQRGEGLFAYLLERYGLTHTLSGMQPKLLVKTDRTTLSYPNCIVKTGDAEFPGLVTNEYLCMSLARDCGLAVPDHYLSAGRDLFIIDRFDMAGDKKLGFEDFCSLMGLSGEDRYSRSYETAVKVLSLYRLPKPDFELFFRQLVFSCAIGNGDAHLKNFGLLYDPTDTVSRPRLSPVYDLTCTLAYEHLDRQLALSMNARREFPDKTGLMTFGRKLGIRNPGALVDEVVTLIRDGLKHHALAEEVPELVKIIDRQAGFTGSESATGIHVPARQRTKRKKFT
ncbi:MAG TPA: type II toxin-antitoxin system HipA family toxin [Saccharospirillum sp.]|nr:type II toxin-antitoxin system HipA family toxin [Saccharospirillum sp.]